MNNTITFVANKIFKAIITRLKFIRITILFVSTKFKPIACLKAWNSFSLATILSNFNVPSLNFILHKKLIFYYLILIWLVVFFHAFVSILLMFVSFFFAFFLLLTGFYTYYLHFLKKFPYFLPLPLWYLSFAFTNNSCLLNQ